MFEAGDEPDVAVPRADRQAIAVRVEVKSGEPDLGQPGIARWPGKDVDGVRAVTLAEADDGGESLGPAGFAASGEGREILIGVFDVE